MKIEKNTVYTIQIQDREFTLIRFALEGISNQGSHNFADKSIIEDMLKTMEEKE